MVSVYYSTTIFKKEKRSLIWPRPYKCTNMSIHALFSEDALLPDALCEERALCTREKKMWYFFVFNLLSIYLTNSYY